MAGRAPPLLVVATLSWGLTACTRSAPHEASPASDAGLQAPAVAAADAGGDASAAEAGAPKPEAPDAAAIEEAVPSGTEAELSLRARHLLEAITQDNADLATDLLFPRDAYSVTREGKDPGKEWERKVVASYHRDVHTLHKRLKGSTAVTFGGFEIGHTLTQITPRKREWTRPLWRVKHSKLSFTVEGKSEHVDIAEMVAWRGAWYVTKLR